MRMTVHRTFSAAQSDWRRFETEAEFYPFQSFAWLSAWHDEIGAKQGVEPCITVVEDDVFGRLLLPLGIERRGVARVLTWLGGTVSDYHGPLLMDGSDRAHTSELVGSWWARLQRALPAFDAVHLERQPDRIGPLTNPFAQLPGKVQDRSFATRLGTDWEACYRAHAGKRSRTTDRRQARRLAEAGGPEFVVALEPAQAEAFTRAVVTDKRRRFPEDRHLRPEYVRLYLRLASEQTGAGVVAAALTLNGETIATSWGLCSNGRMVVLLSGYAPDLSKYSPGRLLQLEVMRWCIEHQIDIYDFALGDEAYKRSWADEQLILTDHIAPYTLRGEIYVAGQRAKAAIKANRRAWRVARRTRDELHRLRQRIPGAR